MKKIIFILTIMITVLSLFYKPNVVYATNDGTLTINVPRNQVNVYSYYNQLTSKNMIQIMIITYKYNGGSNILVNNDGKMVIKIKNHGENTIQYELYDDATEEECVFNITDEIRNRYYNEYGIDVFEGYNKVQFVLKDFENLEQYDNPLVIDINNDELDMPLNDYNIFLISLLYSNSFVAQEQRWFYSSDGKILIKRKNLDEDGLNYEFELGDVSSDDDIIYELADGESLNQLGIDTTDNNYEKIVIKFGDKEYDSSYYVYDFSNKNNEILNNIKEIWDFFITKELVNDYIIVEEIMDLDGNSLFELFDKGSYFKVVNLLDKKYENNITIDLSNDEEIQEMLKGYNENNNIDTIILKFKNPEFLEGNGEEFNTSKDNNISFRLNIPFDRFQKSGSVYMDGELVNPENYIASEGSTIITFKNEYAKKLDSGTHSIRVTVEDGEATASFNVVGISPETGDSILLYIVIGILSLSGIILSKRLKNN